MENIERELLEQCSQVANLAECLTWLQRCDECLAQLEKCSSAKRPRLTVGSRQSIEARIERLTSAKVQLKRLKRRFVHVGGGAHASTSAGNKKSLLWRKIEAAFESRILTGAVINADYIEPRHFLEDASDLVIEQVRDAIAKHASVKVNTVFNGEFVNIRDDRDNKNLATKNYELYRASNLREWYEQRVIEVILAMLDEFQERDSGWALHRIQNLMLNINKLYPMHAGCHFEIPLSISDKHAIINVHSNDNACFAWSVVAALKPAKRNASKESSYPHYSTVLKFGDIQFPIKVKDIGKFERLNDVSVNVYGTEFDRKEKILYVVPLRLTKDKKKKHVNLFYVENKHNTHGHFAWIKNLSRLVSSQLSKKKNKKFICDRCLHYFNLEEKLQLHEVECKKLNDCAIILPREDQKWLEFNSYNNKERVPFVIYADLECVLRKMKNETENTSSFAYQHHEVYSIAYYVKCSFDDALSIYCFRRDKDCVAWFAKELENFAHDIKGRISANVPMEQLTIQQKKAFLNATNCHICEKPFISYKGLTRNERLDNRRVHDHCHLTGKYRGPAHNKCNLNYKNTYVIPVVFHNLSNYDAHFIIKEISTAFKGKIDLLPINKEKYISFTKHVAATGERTKSGKVRNCIRFRFIDSYKFLSASLEKLASFLGIEQLKITRSEFSKLSNEDFELLTRKGVFPYEYVDDADKLLETRLPPRESFYSSLSEQTVSEHDYAHAENVWQRFTIETLGEYSDLYLKTDVLLLADIFENFRDKSMQSYGLDPAHYYTLPGYTWDAMLKKTGIRFELLTDIEMLLYVERGIRGGLSQCSGRYAKANNKYMKSYDPSKPSTYLMYNDVNNLYGWAMCQPLPYGEFKWVENVDNFDVNAIAFESDTGYILEVDLAYENQLHDRHSDLPFCPSSDKPPGSRQKKLLATVHDKKRYVIHYRNLQQCMRHGLEIVKIHRILQFAQSTWLSNYIELNTKFRTNAKNDFEKNLYKLMNNAVYGKTMENVRNHVNIKLVTQWKGRYGAEAMIAAPNFHSRSVFAENLIAIEMRKLSVKFNKPIYVGMCILDISKICLYEFYYDYILPLYQDKCQILYTDTDSLVMAIECDDVYMDIKHDIARYDTSDYPADNIYSMPLENKKVPGLMKDENCGKIMTEFVGLRAKMYAVRVEGKEDTKKVKGVKNSVVERTIMFEDYTRCLHDGIEMIRQQACIRSKLHDVHTIKEKKIALSPFDDKRYILPDSTKTLPWGHWRIPS